MKIACISDTHGIMLPEIDLDTDIILHAGDVGPDHNAEHWLKTTFSSWAMDQGIPIHLTWGNHDFIGEKKSVVDNLNLPPNIHVHKDELVKIPDGPSVWFSPWSPRFGPWAFMLEEQKLKLAYEQIPVMGVDIIVSHTPPFGYRDYTVFYDHKHVGSTSLLNRLRHQLAIQYVICGHIHEARGREKMPHGTEVINCAQVDLNYDPIIDAVEYILW